MVLNLNKAMLDCMQNLRRRLRVELSIDIHLSDDNAVQALIDACRMSDSIRTRELGIELARMSGLDAGDLAGPAAPVAPAAAPQDNMVFPAPPVAEGEKLVRIYRGQRVYG